MIDGTTVFGVRAGEYDRLRPSYPDSALRDALRPLGRLGSAVDAGCGTGILGAALAGFGLAVTGVESDPRMAAVAAARGLRMRTGRFEDVAPDRPVDLVASGQAWHWLDPGRRVEAARRWLRPDGHVLLVWNLPLPEPRRDADLAAVREEVCGAGWDEPARQAERLAPIDLDLFAAELAVGGFGGLRRAAHPWRRTYSAADWADLLATESRQLVLPAQRQADVREAVRRLIEDRYGGWVEERYECQHLSATNRAGGAG